MKRSITTKNLIFYHIYITYISTRVSSFMTYDGNAINNEDRKEF